MKKLLLISLISFSHITQPISLETQKIISGVGIAGGFVGYVYSVIQCNLLNLKIESIQIKLYIDGMTDITRMEAIKILEEKKQSWFATKSIIASYTAAQELLKAKKLTPQEREDLLKEKKKLQYQKYKYIGSLAASTALALGSTAAFINIDLQEQARQEHARQEHARQERARLEREWQEYWQEYWQARQEQARQEQARQQQPQLTTPWYETLGVNGDATYNEVRNKYRTLILQNHPDHSNARDANQRTQRIQEAWDYYRTNIQPLNQNTAPAHAPESNNQQNQAPQAPSATNADELD